MSTQRETASFRHRPGRGALVGDLAVVEMTSVEMMRPYRQAMIRLGVGPQRRRFSDVHVAADARPGVVALGQIVAGLMAGELTLGAEILFRHGRPGPGRRALRAAPPERVVERLLIAAPGPPMTPNRKHQGGAR